MLINYLGCKVSIACPRDGALFHLASALIYWYDSGWFINCWYRCCCCWRLGRVCQQLINSLPISWWRKTESGYSFVLASWQLDIYGCLHWELYSLRGLGHLILGPIVPLTSFFFKIQMFLAPVPVSLSVKFYISPTRRMPKANFFSRLWTLDATLLS